jgi:hypothetical protein
MTNSFQKSVQIEHSIFMEHKNNLREGISEKVEKIVFEE